MKAMNWSIRISSLLLLLVTAAAADPAPCGVEVPTAPRVVTLRQAERIALEQNLNLKAQTFDLLAGEAAVRREYGLYDPRLGLSLVLAENKERLNSLFANDAIRTEQFQYDASLTQRVPTGGTAALDFLNQRMDTTLGPTPDINPNYDSMLRLSLVQPLLKNFGKPVTEQAIRFAVKDRERSVQALRDQAFAVIGGVRDAYFEVLRSRDELAYRETSVEVARRVLKENRARVDVGVMAPIEILEAEVGLQSRERDLLDAQRLYHDALDNLALLLNLREELAVADEPLTAPPLATDPEGGYRTALVGRPDVQGRLREIERLQIEQDVAKNARLPALDLSAAYAHKGLGGDYGDDLGDIGDGSFPNWEIGLNLTYPLGNRAARNEVLRNRVRLKGLQARLNQLHEEVRTEIRVTIRLLEVSAKKIEVTSRGRELAEEKLRTLLKRKEVGLATTRDVLEGEEDLAQARTDQIAALAEYNQAVTQYLRVTGQLLDREGIVLAGAFDPMADPDLLQMKAE